MLVYPEAYNFPLEMTCWEIVSRLEQRNFDVPGIAVTWDDVWNGELHLARLLKVRGQDFSLDFCWPSSSEPASLDRVVIPEKELQLRSYSDEHSLTLNVYAYTDWERDRDWFLADSFKYHSRRDGAPRYLKYQSKCNCSDIHDAAFDDALGRISDYLRSTGPLFPPNTLHTHPGRWSCPLMVFNDHYGTEYAPIEGEEPTVYRTEEVMDEMQQWLTTQVLSRISNTL
jgi:hypothetical protein